MAQNDIMIMDRFHPQATALRREFERKFQDPRVASGDRFVWDYWHIPGQYTLLRTPADSYFSHRQFSKFVHQLVDWGRSILGCHAISQPWLSCYLDGCEQRLHADNPHGPWAFVYSLTNGSKFSGGETQIVRPSMLDYWRNFSAEKGIEEGDLLRRIKPKFNRLTVFDPRLPHGVSRVSGTHDPREGRLVVHGWFVQPQPYFTGGLSRRSMAKSLDEQVQWLGQNLPSGLDLQGYLSLRVRINRAGKVDDVRPLISNLRSISDQQRQVLFRIRQLVGKLQFPRAASASDLVLPLIFDL